MQNGDLETLGLGYLEQEDRTCMVLNLKWVWSGLVWQMLKGTWVRTGLQLSGVSKPTRGSRLGSHQSVDNAHGASPISGLLVGLSACLRLSVCLSLCVFAFCVSLFGAPGPWLAFNFVYGPLQIRTTIYSVPAADKARPRLPH